MSAVLVDVRFYPRFDAHFHIHFHVHISVRNDAHIDVLVDIDVGVHTDVLSDVHNCVRSDNQYMRYSVVAKIVPRSLAQRGALHHILSFWDSVVPDTVYTRFIPGNSLW